jgi:uncharacterized membrane protein
MEKTMTSLSDQIGSSYSVLPNEPAARTSISMQKLPSNNNQSLNEKVERVYEKTKEELEGSGKVTFTDAIDCIISKALEESFNDHKNKTRDIEFVVKGVLEKLNIRVPKTYSLAAYIKAEEERQSLCMCSCVIL